MKLISVHVEGFGKLINTDFSFKDGVNVIEKENGWGKTTLTAFLFVMFYGMDDKLTKKYREKFAPWSGAAYGGSMVIEVGKTKYRIYRTFGRKRAVDDTFMVRNYENNLELNDFDEFLGEEIFKINGDSFLKTVLVGNEGCVTSATDDINAKIGNVSFMEADMREYTNAKTIFKNYLNKNSATRKTGKIYDLQNEQNEAFTKARFAVGIRNELMDSEGKASELKAEQQKLKKLKDEVGKQIFMIIKAREAAIKFERLEELKADLGEAERKLSIKKPKGRGVAVLPFIVAALFLPPSVLASILMVNGWIFGIIGGAISIFLFLAGGLGLADRKNRYAEKKEDAIVDYDRARTKLEDYIAGINLEEVRRLSKSEWVSVSKEECEEYLEKVTKRLEEVEGEIKKLDTRREFLLEELQDAEASEAKAREIEAELVSKIRQAKLCEMANDFLDEAKQSFSGKFVKPVSETLSEYFEAITDEPGDICHLDTNLVLTVDEMGVQRKEEVFSSGRRDVLGIAMRFAMLDVMYREEHPFVIMDDPFKNLDSKTRARTEDFLETLPYQIIILNRT